MIQAAVEAGTAPVLTLTPFGPDGRFNNYLISVLVNDWEVRRTLIQELLYTIDEKGFRGVDIDFEFILAQDRDSFTSFGAI